MRTILLIFLLIIVAVVGFGYYRTWQMQNGSLQEEFVNGTLPEDELDGFYKGTANFPTSSWLGKKFNSEEKTGANVFHTIAGETERFHFKTATGKGLQDKELEVVKIDYDLPTNSWVLRLILDELVEVAPNKYLGKMHVRLPYLPPFTLVYFRLEK